jgi:hypothetical protein
MACLCLHGLLCDLHGLELAEDLGQYRVAHGHGGRSLVKSGILQNSTMNRIWEERKKKEERWWRRSCLYMVRHHAPKPLSAPARRYRLSNLASNSYRQHILRLSCAAALIETRLVFDTQISSSDNNSLIAASQAPTHRCIKWYELKIVLTALKASIWRQHALDTRLPHCLKLNSKHVK